MSNAHLIDKIRAEQYENDDRLSRLNAFIKLPIYADIGAQHQALLLEQRMLMANLSRVLSSRVHELCEEEKA